MWQETNDEFHVNEAMGEDGNEEGEDFTEEEKQNMMELVNGFMLRPHELHTFLGDERRSVKLKRQVLNQQNLNRSTVLYMAIRDRVHHSMVERMMAIGGKDLLLAEQNSQNQNALHQAAICGSQLEVFKALIQACGNKVLLEKDVFGNTPLHYAFRWCESKEVIEYLAKEGGRELLLTTNNKNQVPYIRESMGKTLIRTLVDIGGDEYENHLAYQSQKIDELSIRELIQSNEIHETLKRLNWSNRENILSNHDKSLRSAIWFYGNVSHSFKKDLSVLIKGIIAVGGKKLVEGKDSSGSNTLHYAVFHKVPLDIVELIVETTGDHLVHWQNDWGNTPIHDACWRDTPEEILEFILRREGGIKALQTTSNDNKTPLDILFNADKISDCHIALIQRVWYDSNPDFSMNTAKPLAKNVINRTLSWAYSATDPTFVTSNNFVKSISNQMFVQPFYQVLAMMDFYSQIIIVTSLSMLQCDNLFVSDSPPTCTNSAYLIIFLSIAWLWLLGQELAQISSTKIENYVTDYGNYLHITHIIFVLCIIIYLFDLQLANQSNDYSNFGNILICATASAWIELLFIIGKLSYSICVFTTAFVQIIVALIPVAYVTVLLIAAFAQIYFVAGTAGSNNCQDQEQSNWQCHIESSYFKSFSMLLTADFEFLDWDPEINWHQTIISIFFAIVIGILLLNILIGVVSSVFERVRGASEDSFWRLRLTFLVEMNMIYTNIYNKGGKDDDLISPYEEVLVINRRKAFAEYDDDWMRLKCPPADMDAFFKWWYYSWGSPRPSLRMRLLYFYKYASVKEIILSGEVLINILFGLKYHERLKGRIKIACSLIISYVHFVMIIAVIAVLLVLGLCSFGLLWPKEMKENLFFGPISTNHGGSNEEDEEGKLAWRRLKTEVNDIKNQNAGLKNQISELMIQNMEVLKLIKSEGFWS